MTTKEGEKRILCVGLVCLDHITICDGFPEEDSDQKCVDIIWQRGGNASNSSTILALLGEKCEFVGTISDSVEQRVLNEDLQKYGVIYDHCVIYPSLSTPTATVISNIRNASRTILSSHRNLPELTLDDIKKLPFHKNLYKWIHFEGRPNAEEIKSMLQYIDKLNRQNAIDKITTSVEIEKRRDNLACLFDAADVVFVSKDYAKGLGYLSMEEAVERIYPRCRQGAILVCPWGERGAAAISPDGRTVTSRAYPPIKLVDTLGAGDTFIGATIAALSTGKDVKEAISFACQVAGAKCGMRGWNGMAEQIRRIIS